MNLRIGLFDLQFLKYMNLSTPYPSTAGLLVAGYHKTQRDKVVLLDKVPNFSLYDIVYIIKDDWDLYHDPEWLRHKNVKLIGRYWDSSISTWESAWLETPPDMQPYQKWAETWLKRYPFYKKQRIAHFWYKPVLLNTGTKILNPDDFEVLLIDYNLHELDNDYTILKELHSPYIKMLHPLNVTHNTELAFEFLKQPNIPRGSLWITIDANAEPVEMQRMIDTWNKFRLGRMVRIKVWIEAHNDEDWEKELRMIIPFLANWREQAGKRIYVEPVDIFTYSHPAILIALRRWTGKDMGYAYNSLLDYLIYDSIQNNDKIIQFLQEPYEYIETKQRGYNKMADLVKFIEEEPELSFLISKPINGKGV